MLTKSKVGPLLASLKSGTVEKLLRVCLILTIGLATGAKQSMKKTMSVVKIVTPLMLIARKKSTYFG